MSHNSSARPATIRTVSVLRTHTVAEKYIRVFRSRFAVRRHLCLAFYVRASLFAVRASRFAVRSHLYGGPLGPFGRIAES